MTDRWIIVRVTEEDQRTLLYAPEGQRQITVTRAQDRLWLNPQNLRDLGMWDEAKDLAADLAKPPVARCHAWFGERDDRTKGATCLRAHGHPPLSEDGIGHSRSARYQGL